MDYVPVFNEIDLGYYDRFEAGWFLIALAAGWLMGAFVVVAAAGRMGRGPLSHATSATSDDRLSVDFEPIARANTGTQFTFHLRHLPADTTRVLLTLSVNMVAPMGSSSLRPSAIQNLGGMATSVWYSGCCPTMTTR